MPQSIEASRCVRPRGQQAGVACTSSVRFARSACNVQPKFSRGPADKVKSRSRAETPNVLMLFRLRHFGDVDRDGETEA